MLSKMNKMKKKLKAKEGVDLMENKRFREAIDLFNIAIDIDSNDWRIFVNRSYCFQQIKQFNEALSDANDAIKLDETQIAGHYRKGCILLNMKLFRSAEKSFKDALNCDQNDENCLIKLKETLRLFIKEFGFNNESEIQQLIQLFDSCSAFSDALITGQLFEIYDFGTEYSVENGRTSRIPDESDLMRSVSIMNELNFDFNDNDEELEDDNYIPLVSSTVSNDTSSEDMSQLNGNGSDDLMGFKTPDLSTQVKTESVNGIRLPKSAPFLRRRPKDLETNDPKSPQIVTEKCPEIKVENNTSGKELTPKKIVKTRPLIRRSIVNTN